MAWVRFVLRPGFVSRRGCRRLAGMLGFVRVMLAWPGSNMGGGARVRAYAHPWRAAWRNARARRLRWAGAWVRFALRKLGSFVPGQEFVRAVFSCAWEIHNARSSGSRVRSGDDNGAVRRCGLGSFRGKPSRRTPLRAVRALPAGGAGPCGRVPLWRDGSDWASDGLSAMAGLQRSDRPACREMGDKSKEYMLASAWTIARPDCIGKTDVVSGGERCLVFCAQASHGSLRPCPCGQARTRFTCPFGSVESAREFLLRAGVTPQSEGRRC